MIGEETREVLNELGVILRDIYDRLDKVKERDGNINEWLKDSAKKLEDVNVLLNKAMILDKL